MKTITISDDVYRKLVAIKGGRSFSEVIDDLIRENVGRRVEAILSISGRGLPGDFEEAVRLAREGFRARILEADS